MEPNGASGCGFAVVVFDALFGPLFFLFAYFGLSAAERGPSTIHHAEYHGKVEMGGAALRTLTDTSS